MTFNFFRSGSQYFQLVTTVQPVHTALNRATTSLNLNTTEMGAIATYTISLVTAQPLGINAMIYAYFSTDISFINYSGGCTMKLNNSATLTSVTCSVMTNSTSTTLTTFVIKFTSTGVIPANSNIQITINSLVNALFPTLYNIGL